MALSGLAGERLALVCHAIRAEGHAGDGGIEVQFTLVVGGVVQADEVQAQVAEGLVGFLAHGVAEKVCPGDALGLLDFSIEQELPDFGQMYVRAGADIIVRPAFPERVLIELDAFVGDAAEDHCPQPAVADGQGIRPFFRRLRIPQSCRRHGSGLCLDRRAQDE